MSTNLTMILFELLVSALFWILMVGLTKQYVLPILREQIFLFRKYFEDLQKKYSLTLDTKDSLIKKIAQQKDYLSELEQKIKNWHLSLEHKRLKFKARQKELSESLLQKRTYQLDKVQSIKLRQTVVPHAIQLTREKLLSEYSGETGRNILVRLLSQMDQQSKTEQFKEKKP
jgi:hypothetical protein